MTCQRCNEDLLSHHGLNRALRLNPLALVLLAHNDWTLECLEQVADFVLNWVGQCCPFRFDRLLGDATDVRLQVGEALARLVFSILTIIGPVSFGRHHEVNATGLGGRDCRDASSPKQSGQSGGAAGSALRKYAVNNLVYDKVAGKASTSSSLDLNEPFQYRKLRFHWAIQSIHCAGTRGSWLVEWVDHSL